MLYCIFLNISYIEIEVSIPMDCPSYVKNVIEGFHENKRELYNLIGKGLLMKDIYLFEKSAESILGAEIDGLRDYIIQKYRLDKDKFKIKFNEFQRLVQEWVNYESRKNTDYMMGEDTQQNIYNISQTSNINQPDEENDQSIRHTKTKLKLMLRLKIEKHFEKIKEIFENHSDEFQARLAEEKRIASQPLVVPAHPKSAKNLSEVKSKKEKEHSGDDSEGEDEGEESEEEKDDENKEKASKKEKSEIAKDENAIVIPVKQFKQNIETKVKLSKMDKVINDIAYLIGLGMLTVQESNSNIKIKRSSAKAIDEFIHFIWKKKHDFLLEQKNIYSKDKSILKKGDKKKINKSSNKAESNKESEPSEKSDDRSEHNHKEDSKKASQKVSQSKQSKNEPKKTKHEPQKVTEKDKSDDK